MKPHAQKQSRDRKPGRPRGKPRQDMKETLLMAAIHLFAERGFDGVSLSQIAKRAEADIALTRYYFGSKAALWTTAMSHLADCFVASLNDANRFQQGSKADALKDLIRAFVFASAEWPQVSRVIVFDGDQSDARGEFIQTRFVAPFYHLLSDLIEAAKDEGQIPDVSTRTIFFMITHGGSFPMALPALTNAFPGDDIASKPGLSAHADAIVSLIFRPAEAKAPL